MDQIIEEIIGNSGALSKETIAGMSDDEKKELLNGYLSNSNINIRFLYRKIETNARAIADYKELAEKAMNSGKNELENEIRQEIESLKQKNEELRQRIVILENEANKERVNPEIIARTSNEAGITSSGIGEAKGAVEEPVIKGDNQKGENK